MLISLCVVAYNEQEFLPDLLKDIINQDYPREKTEIIFIDNGSTDNTKAIMQKFLSENTFFNSMLISINRSNLAVGCNTAIKNMTGDVYVRVDAHAGIAPDFLSKTAECILGGENVCGGYRPCVTHDDTPMQKTLLLAESSMFGSSFAAYRREHKEKTYMPSLFHMAVKKEVFDKCGSYDERLGRTEDNEFAYRLRSHGYKLCYYPGIRSKQKVRSSIKKIVTQKYKNGYWIGLTLGVCPKCFSIFHFAPLAFVLAIIFSVLFALFLNPIPLLLLAAAYLAFDLAITVSAFVSSKNIYPVYFLLPFIFLILHLAYGAGTLIGIIYMPVWKIRNKSNN